LAYEAEKLARLLFDKRIKWRRARGKPPDALEKAVYTLLRACRTKCDPFLPQLRIAFAPRAVAGWDRAASSAVEALMDFTCRVLVEWACRRGEAIACEVGEVPWEELSKPTPGQFGSLVQQEFCKVKLALQEGTALPVTGLDDEDVRILKPMVENPRRRYTVRALCTACGRTVCETTIKQRLKRFQSHGLIEREQGPKRGARITEKGKRAYDEYRRSAP
jgi:hypothetical protein